jgi:hypothetical protein
MHKTRVRKAEMIHACRDKDVRFDKSRLRLLVQYHAF